MANTSLPAREAWIEIKSGNGSFNIRCLSLPAREAWIEIVAEAVLRSVTVSLPAREAWIEMAAKTIVLMVALVASREGGVD